MQTEKALHKFYTVLSLFPAKEETSANLREKQPSLPKAEKIYLVPFASECNTKRGRKAFLLLGVPKS